MTTKMFQPLTATKMVIRPVCATVMTSRDIPLCVTATIRRTCEQEQLQGSQKETSRTEKIP